MGWTTLSRRRLLATAGTAGVGAIVGCSGDGQESTRTEAGTGNGEPRATGTRRTDTAPAETTDGDVENRIYVDTDGSDDGEGTADDPLSTIGLAVEQAEPGDTVYVNSGEYQQFVRIETDGTESEPIELTGPPDAVLRRPADQPAAAIVGGDHVHITGLSITGLADPSRPEDADAYADAPLVMVTTTSFDTYNHGAVVSPHRIGNSGAQLVKFRFCRDAEAGPFRVSGRAGAKWQLTGSGHPSGEIVYVGTSPSTIEEAEPVDSWDNTRDVRVHHVDNSAGHPHGQLVDIKPGTENVTVEYCTDGGGSYNNKDWAARSLAIRGHAATVRWNRLQDGEGVGIGVGSGHNTEPENELQEQAGDGNEIYGNEVFGFGQEAIWFPYQSTAGQRPEDQAIICGNTVDEPTDAAPAVACPSDIPTTERIGHVGGESPWEDERLPEVSRASFTVEASLETDVVAVGEPVPMSVTVRNDGTAEGTKSLRVTTNGSELTSERVTVPAGETVRTEITVPGAPEAGTYTLRLNGEPVGDITVEEGE